MLRPIGAGLVPHKKNVHSPTVSSASERTFPQSSSRRSETLCALKVANNSSPMPDLIPKVKQSGASLATTPQLRNAVLPYLRRAHSSSPHQSLNAMTPISKRTMKKKRAEGKPYSPATVANARHIAPRVLADQTRYAVWKARVGLVQKIILFQLATKWQADHPHHPFDF